MMILSIILLITSFLLQGLMSNFFSFIYGDVSYLITNYILITLLLIYPYFQNKKKYLILLLIFGYLTDIVYSNTTFLNISLFFLIYELNKFFHFLFPYNYLTINVSNVLGIFIYHIISFIILATLNYDNYSFIMLLKILGSSILMTIIYTSTNYFIITSLKKKMELKDVK